MSEPSSVRVEGPGVGAGRALADTLGWSTAPTDVRATVVLFATAFLLYLPGIGWGLPLGISPGWTGGWSPDGVAPMGFGEVYYAFFSESPRFSPQYPMFHHFVQAIVCAPVLLVVWATGGIESFSTTFPYGLVDPPTTLRWLTLAGRFPSLVMGSATVAIVYQTARELWGRRAGALAAVGALCVAPLVFYSRTSNVDVPALFWTALGLSVFAACIHRGVTLERSMVFGLFAALALGTKDTYYSAFLPMAAVLPFLAAGPEEGGAPSARPVWWRPDRERMRILVIGLVVGLSAYAVTSGLAIHLERYWSHLRFIFVGPHWYAPSTSIELAGTLTQTVDGLADATGWPGVGLAVLGIAYASRRSAPSLLLLLPGLGTVAGVVVPSGYVFPRFLVLPAVLTAVFAGYALDRLLASSHRWLRVVGIVVTTGAIGWGLARAGDLTYAMLADTRIEAARWLEDHVEPDDCIAHTRWLEKSPRLPAAVRTMQLPWEQDPLLILIEEKPEWMIEVAASPLEEEGELLVEPWLREWLTTAGDYELVLELPYSGRITDRLIPWVSPPIRIWARREPVTTRRFSLRCVNPWSL